MDAYNREGVGRLYKTPKGDFPSVTTVLSCAGDSSWLDEWRSRIGEEKADAIVKEATDIGSHLHYLFECLVQNIEPEPADSPEKIQATKMFGRSKSKLLAILDEVIGIEVPVYSEKFRIAGRFDLLLKGKNGKVILLDYKNTKREKKREDIGGYRLQLAFYGLMIKETLGIEVEEHKIFMVNREGFVQIFTFLPSETERRELVEIRKRFWEKHGI